MSNLRPRGGKTPRQKWVDYNHRARNEAKKLNNGILPPSLALETSDFPNKEIWSEDNLPEILFYVIPPKSQYVGKRPGNLLDSEGKPVIVDGHIVRDFEILPRSIAVDVKGWLVEAWRRTDPRIKYQDILDRMTEDLNYCGGIGLRKPNKNSLQNDCRRGCRKIVNAWVEYGRRDVPHRTEVEAIEKLSYDNVVLNTVLPYCPGTNNSRLVKLRLERKTDDGSFKAVPFQVTVANYMEATLPLNFFLDAPIPDCEAAMTSEMEAAVELLFTLQERAGVHGLSHWSKLERTCLPVSWFDRTKNKSVDNQTYDGGCEKCTWYPTRDEDLRTERAALLKSYQTLKRDRESASEDDDEQPASKRQSRITRRSTAHAPDECSPLSPPRPYVKYQIKYLESDEEDDGSYDAEAELEEDEGNLEQSSCQLPAAPASPHTTNDQVEDSVHAAYPELGLVENLTSLNPPFFDDEMLELGTTTAAATQYDDLNDAQNHDQLADFMPDFLNLFGHDAMTDPELPHNRKSLDESTINEIRAIQQFLNSSSAEVTSDARNISFLSTQIEWSQPSSTSLQSLPNQGRHQSPASVEIWPSQTSDQQPHEPFFEAQLQTQRLQQALAMGPGNAADPFDDRTNSCGIFNAMGEIFNDKANSVVQVSHFIYGSHHHGWNSTGSLAGPDAAFSSDQGFPCTIMRDDQIHEILSFATSVENVEFPQPSFSELFDAPQPQFSPLAILSMQGDTTTLMYACDIMSPPSSFEPEGNPYSPIDPYDCELALVFHENIALFS